MAIPKEADADGQFRRKASQFRSMISNEPGAEFPAEADRYVLYINLVCPWAHRTNIARSLKGLDNIVQVVIMAPRMGAEGWEFTGTHGTAEKDPLYGFTKIRQFYFKADPDYSGRFTIPCLWDKKKETIVSNESADIIRMFYNAFDDLLPTELKEVNKPNGGLLAPELSKQIDEVNEYVYNDINNGVYKCGFAGSQEAYDTNVVTVFNALDRMEKHLESVKDQGPYIFGAHLTDSDLRLYTTIIRFDVGYFQQFKVNLRMIRYEYPNLHRWLRHLYWDAGEETRGAFKGTTDFDQIKYGFAAFDKYISMGPLPYIMPL